MKTTDTTYQTYLAILEKQLVPAMGCTEPIALAYCAAKARAILGKMPVRVEIELSGNIIKNVKSVIVPNTNGEKGIETAVAMGIFAGDEKLELEVLSKITEEQKREFLNYKANTQFTVKKSESEHVLDIFVRVWSEDGENAAVRIVNEHTKIVYAEKNGTVLIEEKISAPTEQKKDDLDYSLLTIEGIVEFAECVELEDIKPILNRQITYNTAISEEGLKNNYGANIGSVLMNSEEATTKTRAKARAAAGSDARMSGCELPVVINSGSGNQGLTVSLPVIEYAEALKVKQEKLYRALVISNLTAVHLKTGIGALSAYCGAVSAGAAAGAGIAYLRGGDYVDVAHTIVNALAITSGIICDGAKPSCAAKIATAVDAGILGHDMYLQGQQFYGGDGVISKGVENTIRNIGRLGRDGMRETDREILDIMTCVD